MGTKISMVSLSFPFLSFAPGNSISLSSKAVKKCLASGKTDLSDIGLIIGTGIYRHRNTGEPSIASMVQKKLLGHRQLRPERGGSQEFEKTAFSFDLNQGACGWLAGIQIIDGFIQSGDIRHGLVFTSDSEPFRGSSVNYRYDPAAATIILSGSEADGGFSDFRTYNYPDLAEEFVSSTRFEKMNGKTGKRNILFIEQKDSYLENCIDCASESLKKYVAETGIGLNEIDMIISSRSPEGLISGLRERTGLGQKIVDAITKRNKKLHTAGPAFTLKQTWDDNSFRDSKKILFLTVGSGIIVSLATYINSFHYGRNRRTE